MDLWGEGGGGGVAYIYIYIEVSNMGRYTHIYIYMQVVSRKDSNAVLDNKELYVTRSPGFDHEA